MSWILSLSFQLKTRQLQEQCALNKEELDGVHRIGMKGIKGFMGIKMK